MLRPVRPVLVAAVRGGFAGFASCEEAAPCLLETMEVAAPPSGASMKGRGETGPSRDEGDEVPDFGGGCVIEAQGHRSRRDGEQEVPFGLLNQVVSP